MTKAICRYLISVPVSWLATILNYPLAPLVVLFAGEEGWLPAWLWWFQTPDNSLDGDHGWRTEHRWFRDSLLADRGWRSWVNRFRWLWRNSMHGFEQVVLGFTPLPGFTYDHQGQQLTSNRPLVGGRVWRTVVNPGGQSAFQFYFVRAWSSKYCLRINLGWKLWAEPVAGRICQHVVSTNLFMGWGL